MPRELHSHKVNGCNDAIKIEAIDEPGSGGASHLYSITGFNGGTNPCDPFKALQAAPAVRLHVLFQNGPIPDVGTNGVTHESLIAIVIDRLQAFQRGPYACRENAIAMTKLEESLHWLKHRTEERLRRGVEGTHNP